MLAGFNGQEGGILMAIQMAAILKMRNESLDECCGLSALIDIVNGWCYMIITDQAPELCVQFYAEEYGLYAATDNKERAVILGDILGNSVWSSSP